MTALQNAGRIAHGTPDRSSERNDSTHSPEKGGQKRWSNVKMILNKITSNAEFASD
jgi:hypothetical protein